ncbi:MAG: aminoacyl-tRNA hydrolase [Deltaproteobacteria bacterium]|nr:aminoacyl-tRNA hydrolase [Deltaproteobacteria bacterium]
MKLVVGLGNPGKEYERTRHNAGAVLLGRFAANRGIVRWKGRFDSSFAEGELESENFFLLCPQKFMNRSGEAVKEALYFYKLGGDDLMVVHDDIDLAVGRAQQVFDAGAAGHKGVLSIADHLGTNAFYRIRLGVGRPALKGQVEDYVLSPFFPEEEEAVGRMYEQGERLIENWIRK